MKRGFTLLELIIVIVILGIMATLAINQYTKMVEKSRGAEARIIIGSIRTYESATRVQYNSCSSLADQVGIGSDFPSACATTHYFSYNITGVSGNTFTAVATRCTTSSKTPNATVAGTVSLVTNFDNGLDNWVTTNSY